MPPGRRRSARDTFLRIHFVPTLTNLWQALGRIQRHGRVALERVAARARLQRPVKRSLLFEVSPIDPLTLSVASLALLVVAAVAGWIPARRASRFSPMEAMR